jgi:cellulose synthase (UDP-forming)
LAYLFFGLQIFVATIEEVMVYMGAYMAISFMVQNALYARVRWPLMSEIYETAQAPYLAGVVLRTIFKPRGAKFNVTAKDEVLEEDLSLADLQAASGALGSGRAGGAGGGGALGAVSR